MSGAVCVRGALALQLCLVFLQNGCWGAHHGKSGEMSLCRMLVLHRCRSQNCALLKDSMQKSTLTPRDYRLTGLDSLFICVAL